MAKPLVCPAIPPGCNGVLTDLYCAVARDDNSSEAYFSAPSRYHAKALNRLDVMAMIANPVN